MPWPQEVSASTRYSKPIRIDLDGRTFLVPRAARLQMNGAGNQPDAEIEVEIIDGVPEVRALIIRAKTRGKPVQAAHLRALNLEKLALEAFLRLGDEVEETGADDFEYKGPVATRKGARTAVSGALDPKERELRRVAETYLKNIDGHPREHVMALLQVTASTADRRIRQAAQAGLLPPTTPGKKRGKA